MRAANTARTLHEQNEQPSLVPIAMRVRDACRFIGIGRSTLYVLIASGEIEIIKLGGSTLVLTESLRQLVASRRNPGAFAASNGQV